MMHQGIDASCQSVNAQSKLPKFAHLQPQLLLGDRIDRPLVPMLGPFELLCLNLVYVTHKTREM